MPTALYRQRDLCPGVGSELRICANALGDVWTTTSVPLQNVVQCTLDAPPSG
jgi:hypothetical protein